ncbi:MAG: 4Fe-4S dicluster domain-containing protein [Gammaproteobacteria bacterium]|nr:4Fe-4S dicluster domain-containing protein [Gammaproteobacteria bacterium]
MVKRRTFLKEVIGAAMVMAAAPLAEARLSARKTNLRYLRPPGALSEEKFLSRCIHCGQCSESCPNRCLKFFNFENGTASLDTPYIIPREKACILCMKCGKACPTGAIAPIERNAKEITSRVRMGRARVDKNICLSYQGKTCGVCYRACPLPDLAIRVGMLEQPHVLDACVGCGLCERICIQIPPAIRIIPDLQQNRQT